MLHYTGFVVTWNSLSSTTACFCREEWCSQLINWTVPFCSQLPVDPHFSTTSCISAWTLTPKWKPKTSTWKDTKASVGQSIIDAGTLPHICLRSRFAVFLLGSNKGQGLLKFFFALRGNWKSISGYFICTENYSILRFPGFHYPFSLTYIALDDFI